jgi:hypothetical protein
MPVKVLNQAPVVAPARKVKSKIKIANGIVTSSK